MRVAFVTTFCSHYRRPLFELLARRFEVDFYFQSTGAERYWNPELAAVSGEFRVVPSRRLSPGGQPFLPGIARALTPRRYDAVLKSLDGRLMTPYVYGLSSARGLPFVLWTGMWHHPQTVFHGLTRPVTERVYRNASAIVAYGEHVRRFLCTVRGVAAEKVFVAGQAVEREPFAACAPSLAEPPEILYVGQLEPRKGIAELASAFSALHDTPATLTLAGTGSLEAELRAQADRDPRVRLLGHVAQPDVPGLLSRARCLVLPSVTTRRDREPWGLVVNEAMHAGVPAVVTSAVGAAAGGLVRDGRNGLVVPERDADALARALRTLVLDGALAQRLGERARQDVDSLTYEAMADAFEAALVHATGGSA
jgi:glycosyltransferase involved in cell wall biosynthesis